MRTLRILSAAFLIAVLSFSNLFAEENKTQTPPKKKIKVALVLCGGGAKGAAHIGVIKKLEEVGIRPDMVLGTSMGALIGGLYAMGYNSSQMDSVISGADWDYLLSDNIRREDLNFSKKQDEEKFFMSIPFYNIYGEKKGESKQEKSMFNLPGGFVSGNNVLNLLTDLALGYQDSINFNTLPIPFACIATDLATGEEVVLDHGSLPLAMRASMAIPGFFAPVEIDGKVLVDGGVVNNFPVDVARKKGADIVIGVDVQTDLASAENLKSIDAVLMQLISLMGNDLFMENKEHTDIYIHPDVSKFGTLSFNKEAVDTLMANGYKAAQERDEALRALAKLTGTKSLKEIQKEDIYKTNFRITELVCEGMDIDDRGWLLKMAGLEEGKEVTGTQINKAISIFKGTQAFSQVTYSLTKNARTVDPEDYVLTFKFTKGPSNYVSVGARYDTEEAAAMLLRVGINQYALHGSRMDLTGRVSFNPNVRLGYDYVFSKYPRLETSYMFAKKDVNIYSDESSRNNVTFIYNGLEAAIANIKYFRALDVRLGTRLENFKFTKFLSSKMVSGHIKAHSYWSVFARGIMDTRDSKYFPTDGSYLQVDGAYYFVGFHSGFKSFTSWMVSFNMAFDLGDNFVLQPYIWGRVNVRNRLEQPYYNFVGGSEQGRYLDHQIPFIGINYANAFDNSVSVFRLDLRKKLGKKHYVYAMGNYLRNGKSLDKMVSFDRKGYWGVGAQYSYDTKIGPLTFNLHWSDYNKKKIGAYLSFGYFF
ncbi:MAG: patatin-like phospholipase family protein [Bacteroidales bacterium]|nr:patatin-like phospholipase family protein [Bacteroidales bacterium]